MKTNITKEDVLALREELLQYAEKAEQHEFPKIMLVHLNLDKTIEQFEKCSMKELNTMFRVVYGIIGKGRKPHPRVLSGRGFGKTCMIRMVDGKPVITGTQNSTNIMED